MSNLRITLVGACAAVLLAGCSSNEGPHRLGLGQPASLPGTLEADTDDEVEVALDQVPAAIKAAATSAVPGLTLTSAEKEIEGGTLVYCLEGSANGKWYEVEVDAAGRVTEIEGADGDDADDDADDDDETDD